MEEVALSCTSKGCMNKIRVPRHMADILKSRVRCNACSAQYHPAFHPVTLVDHSVITNSILQERDDTVFTADEQSVLAIVHRHVTIVKEGGESPIIRQQAGGRYRVVRLADFVRQLKRAGSLKTHRSPETIVESLVRKRALVKVLSDTSYHRGILTLPDPPPP